MIAEIRSRLSEAAEGTTPLWINLRTLKQRTWGGAVAKANYRQAAIGQRTACRGAV